MKNKVYISIFVFLFISVSVVLCQNESDSIVISYKAEIEKYRKGKNIKLMYSESSPFEKSQLNNFNGLNYFPANIKYKVEATLIKNEKPEDVIMKTSTDREPLYVRYGEVKFKIDTFNLTLAVFQNKKMLDLSKDEKYLFVPFKDETSGKESYGGGRYIDCEIPESGNTMILDFNKAYNPYCAYNHKYSCVIPPEENRMPIRIEAGEKKYEE